MIGQLDPSSKKAVVIGGGISGLLAAYGLMKRGMDVEVFERADRVGGLIATAQTRYGIAESAAHSFLATPEIESFCSELGVELARVKKESRARFILRNGKLSKFPLSPVEATRAFSRAYFILADKKNPNPSFEDWANRHLGKPVADYLLNPFLRGIYSARPSELSVSAVYPDLVVPPGHSLLSYMLSRSRRKDKKRVPKKMSVPRDGMESIARGLESKLQGRIKTGVVISELPDCPNIVLCTPTENAAVLLREHDPELSKALLAVRYAPLVTATVFVENSAFKNVPCGIGFLIPEREHRQVLGILFNSSAFPGRSKDESKVSSFTVMVGGTAQSELTLLTDEEIERLIENEMKSLLGMGEAPIEVVMHRWPRAIPIYDSQLEQAWARAREGWCSKPGRILFGNYAGQVSLRGMIESSLRLAQ